MGMLDLQGMIDGVKRGRLTRRGFIRRLAALGLTAPMATQLLAIGGVAMAQPQTGYKPTQRGGGGTLKLLWWQGPTLLNPHFAVGTKDQDASYLFYEPLAVWDNDGNLVAKLAAEIPSRENGALAADGRSVVWKLKQGVQWHDGQPFTADDVVFNWQYSSDPATATVTSGAYSGLKVEKIRRPQCAHPVRQADPVLGRGIRRRLRDDHPEAHIRTLYRCEVARGARQPCPGRYRPVQVQGLPPGRSCLRRHQHELPRAQPAIFRRARVEGRRRRGIGRAGRATNRRIRLRLEPPGRG